MNNLDKTPEVENPAQKLVRKLQENKSSLHIARIPKKTREIFIALADKEFCSDYGMTLKTLVDKFVAIDNQHILDKLSEHEERIKKLEEQSCKQSLNAILSQRNQMDSHKLVWRYLH